MANEKLFGTFPEGFMWGTATASYQIEGFKALLTILFKISLFYFYLQYKNNFNHLFIF